MNKIKTLGLSYLFMALAGVFALSSCDVVAGIFISDSTNSGDPYGTVREGEDPGYLGSTNYRYVNGDNYITNTNGNVLLAIQDPDGDDLGDGNIRPHRVNYYDGMYDIHEVLITADSANIYFYVSFQERYYKGASLSADSVAGFFQPFIGIFLSDGNGVGNTNLQIYSPADGTPDQHDSMVNSDLPVDYGIGIVGMTSPNAGSLFNAYDNSNPVAAIKTGPNLSVLDTNNIIRTPNNYDMLNPSASEISTVFAFSVPRVAPFDVAGTWQIFLFSYNWEDYGLQNCNPGNNGYLRQNTGATPSSYMFGLSGGGDYVLFCDMLSTNSGRQETVFASGGTEALTSADFFEIALP